MDIRITSIDSDIVNKVDKIAGKRGFSRNHYLRQILEQLPYIEEVKDFENRYKILINDLKDIIRENTMAYKDILELTKDLKELKEFNKIKNE